MGLSKVSTIVMQAEFGPKGSDRQNRAKILSENSIGPYLGVLPSARFNKKECESDNARREPARPNRSNFTKGRYSPSLSKVLAIRIAVILGRMDDQP
jgi:hypothetical protein